MALEKFKNRARKIYANQLINQLLSIKSQFSSFNYNNKQELENKPKITKLKLKNKIEKKDKIINELN